MYKENETIELKKSLSQLKEGIISLSSMLNKQNYGTLYFGINDDGKIFGVNIGKNTLKDIFFIFITHHIIKIIIKKYFISNNFNKIYFFIQRILCLYCLLLMTA